VIAELRRRDRDACERHLDQVDDGDAPASASNSPPLGRRRRDRPVRAPRRDPYERLQRLAKLRIVDSMFGGEALL
jgi:hypothetical protein